MILICIPREFLQLPSIISLHRIFDNACKTVITMSVCAESSNASNTFMIILWMIDGIDWFTSWLNRMQPILFWRQQVPIVSVAIELLMLLKLLQGCCCWIVGSIIPTAADWWFVWCPNICRFFNFGLEQDTSIASQMLLNNYFRRIVALFPQFT